ncbi:ADP-ribosylglycohydrolase family protein [Fimbriiglobus ruber]|uniref:Putative hydrolase n=1 Tax=Fimbriiglobus ruber TaxID=1908690 RepID=A0A225DDK9_9BACT|nr:ADP-ribosylglycohydrolase family protein [Fimbriiglobus ruber]OWK36608.1 putative hydrolase [Fimbriiglobus ruber]
MLGAIVGDVIGSVHERAGTKTKTFPLFTPESRFTDDTVLTLAVADTLLHGRDYVDSFHEYFAAYPDAGYGGTFYMWALSRRRESYQSYGNGSAMRVSPVAYVGTTLEEVLAGAEKSAAVTHDHVEGIRGAQATAAAIFLARTGGTKEQIRRYIETQFDYFLDETLDELRPTYPFDASCQRSVPQSIIAFLESTDYEDAVRNAISLGGDADTMACIAGAIAEPFYGGVPDAIAGPALATLDDRLRGVVATFRERFGSGNRRS